MNGRSPAVAVLFDNPEDLLAAVGRLRERWPVPAPQQALLQRLLTTLRRLNRHREFSIETYTPCPVEGIDELLGRRPSRLPVAFLLTGLLGAGGGYMLQYWGASNYPVNVGGRPINSWVAFGTSIVEIAILAALVVGFAAYLWATKLTRLYDPIFAVPGFERAAQDRYLVYVRGRDRVEVEALLGPLRPRRIVEVAA